ncbi:MAG: HdeD family acid-resistance protein [Alsobacter sp.]
MSNATPSTSPLGPSLGSALEALRGRWGWIVGIGVLLLVFGMVALGSVVTATVASVWTVGLMMILSGASEMAHGFAMKTWGKSILWIILGLLYGLAGVFTFMNPLLAAGVLTLLLGAGLVASGIVRIILAFQMKSCQPWIWVVLSGLVTVLLGGMILAHWPASSLYVLGIFLGIDLVFAGVSWIMMGLALRRA